MKPNTVLLVMATMMVAFVVSLLCNMVLRPIWQQETRLFGSEPPRDSHAVNLSQSTGSLVVVQDDQEPVLVSVNSNTRVYFIPAQ